MSVRIILLIHTPSTLYCLTGLYTRPFRIVFPDVSSSQHVYWSPLHAAAGVSAKIALIILELHLKNPIVSPLALR
jgi:hypothetical protein